MISHIQSTTIAVADLDAALDFYLNTLGWEKALDITVEERTRWLTVAPSGATTQLDLRRTSWSGDGPVPARSVITLVCNDIDATCASLSRRGVTASQPVAMMPWGQRAAWFSNIDGNQFILVEHAHSPE